ncbi:TIGR01244 family sulfur transferase [Arhodomonas aquaeolei]|uniref:TIGR01244 family sulfur transferase n=1 Tax=Arhodomonas aquaeolei TaxID=2369 RepID=UPI0003604655
METRKPLSPFYAVTTQLRASDLGALAAEGVQTVINNRPDGESGDQPAGAELAAAAERLGIAYHYVPVVSGQITDDDVRAFATILANARGPVVAFCRTGSRSTSLWALNEARHLAPDAVLATCATAGYDLSGLRPRLEAAWSADTTGEATDTGNGRRYDVLIVGGGAAGLATAASLLARRPALDIAVIEPREQHYYQPGWTLVGGGVFRREQTVRPMADLMPAGARWIRAAVAAFEPGQNRVVLEDGERLSYRTLVAAPGIRLDWAAIEGLSETLGRNGVTSNYRYEMASYTWDLVQGLHGGRALFTQPPMPIKCAGAPQKAMYLACDEWRRRGVLDAIDVEFNSAGAVLFGVETFVPPLMRYVERYGIDLAFNSNLVAVDGPARTARFRVQDASGNERLVDKDFDMLHVCPPQTAPDVVREGPLANAGGWIDVDPETLQHVRYGNVFGLGDACGAPNAKTAAAVRKQAPVVAENVIATLDGLRCRAVYDGYGSCPLTVARGRVILAEFGYGGKLLPTFPLDPTVPRWSMWMLKEKWMPGIYFNLMLRGREWLARPRRLPHDPEAREARDALREGPARHR